MESLSIASTMCSNKGRPSRSGMKAFHQMITELRSKTAGMSLSDMMDSVVTGVGYMDYLLDEADSTEKYLEQEEYINKLNDSFAEYEKESAEQGVEPSLIEFLRMNGVEGTTVDVDTDPSRKRVYVHLKEGRPKSTDTLPGVS